MSDEEILDAAREVLRRHGHGIAATCSRACLWGGRIPSAVSEAEWEAEHPGETYPLR